jgi:hypothetical protein
MVFGKWFGKQPAATSSAEQGASSKPTAESAPPVLPDGRVFWEIRRATGNDAKVGHGIGYYLVLGTEWDELGKQRRAAATAAAPKFAHLWGSSGFPAHEYRYKPEHFPRHMTLNTKVPKKRKLPEYSNIGSAEAADVVSARMAEIIERFEPGRFNFIPFTCAPESGEPVHHFCFWQPREACNPDAVLFERSGYEQAMAPNGGSYWRQPWREEQPPLILDAAKVTGRHWLTTGGFNVPIHRVISDELKQALGDFLPEGLRLVEARAV